MLLDSVKAQDTAVAALRAAINSSRVPGAMLFAGPSGVGKAFAAFETAKAILCRKGPADACNKCPSCRRVDSRTHGDLFLLGIPEGKAAIGIEGVRDLCTRISETPMEGQRKVAIVDPADALTEEAQNAFLKTLEEPPSDTTILLIAENTDALLATVRSRCRRINFRRLPDEFVKAALCDRGVDRATAAALARLADGSLARAFALVDSDALETRRQAVDLFLGAKPGAEEDIGEWLSSGGSAGRSGKKLKDRRQDAVAVLSTVDSVLVDCLRWKSGAPIRANADLAPRIEPYARALELEVLTSLEKEVSDAIILIGAYADVKLVALRVAAAFARAGARVQLEAE